MSGTYILAIDQGTTGTTAMVFDAENQLIPLAKVNTEFPIQYPADGWVEQDLEDIWNSVAKSVAEALVLAERKDPNFQTQKLKTIGITNQRETLCVFAPSSGKPLHNAIVWQCRRSTEICAKLKSKGLESMVREKTGLVLDPYFSGTKLTWLIQNHTEIKEKIENQQALVGTIDSWLVYKLTGGRSFVTETSNASRTLIFNINDGRWDPELMTALGLPEIESVLPEVRDSADNFGDTAGLDFLPDGIPINGILGDQQAALAGQTCFAAGDSKCTYGTGAFLLMNTGSERKTSHHGQLSTIAWRLDGQLTYAFEGSAFIAGAVVQYLRDELEFIQTASESKALAEGVQAAPYLYFVPAFTGMGAPRWDPKARGAILGMTRSTSKAQVTRAALEGMTLQVRDLVFAMEQDLGKKTKTLRVDGGAASNDLLMQIQANLTSTEVDRPSQLETTALGAAMFAGLGAGIFANLAELQEMRISDRMFQPVTAENQEDILRGWERANDAVQLFAKEPETST